MERMDTSFDPDALSNMLEPMQGARCHGALTGALCVDDDPRRTAAVVSPIVPGIDSETLERWAVGIQAGLRSSDFSFRLYLPSDESTLATRIGTLSNWCREFLSALGGAGERLNKLGEDIRDTLHELEIIAQGAEVGEDDEEAEETMYAELSEHVRLSALFLYQALNPPGSHVAQ